MGGHTVPTHPRKILDFGFCTRITEPSWIPAYAGMTGVWSCSENALSFIQCLKEDDWQWE